MATTTPNFGWAVPTSTDLVKDGAVAIETLGDSIDASLVDLKGGTTGQVLKKATNTDMDFVWSADSAGMTNPMTTTGDTIYSSSGSTPARLGIGSTGQVLTVAGGVPSWATPASGTPTFVGCALTKTAVQSTANNTLTTMTWDSENFDTDGFHDNVTNNSRITIPSGKAGKYLFTSIINWNNSASGYREVRFTRNGTAQSYANIAATPTGEAGTVITTILNCSVGDYVDVRVEQSSGGSLDVKSYSLFQCQYLGA
jgi:hypothetical protein